MVDVTLGEVLVVVAIGLVLALIVGGYMVYTRRRGWM
jgi:hypothetical protein